MLYALTLCTLLGYGVSYDGQLENKHFFQLNTPNVNYGFVVKIENQSTTMYWDMIHYKNKK